MKTKQELLNFYRVEVGKKYKVVNCNTADNGLIFEVINSNSMVAGVAVRFEKTNNINSISVLNVLNYEEYKPPILDDVERKYLQHYLMDNPAFKGKVMEIAKFAEIDNERGFLVIYLLDGDLEGLPYFPLDMMYKGMELEKHYSVQELGLKR